MTKLSDGMEKFLARGPDSYLDGKKLDLMCALIRAYEEEREAVQNYQNMLAFRPGADSLKAARDADAKTKAVQKIKSEIEK